MQITLFSNFSKRSNSTLQATGGTNVTVTLKDNTSIEDPAFELGAGLSTYDNVTAVLWDSRYYTVTDVTSTSNGTTIISCTLDRPATFKSSITGASAFIERCADTYSLDIRDDNVMTTSKTFVKNTSGGSFLPSDIKSGIIVVGIASTQASRPSGGTVRLAYFDNTSGGTYNVDNLITALYDDDVISSVKKLFANPYDSILSCRYIPGFTCTDLLATNKFTATTGITFGDYSYTTINNLMPTGMGAHTYTKTYEFDLDLVEYYTTYTWRNYEPYSSWTIFLPFYGTISIPASEYIGNEGGACTLYIKATVDLTTGELVYTRYRRVYVSGVATDYIAQEYRTTIGVEIPIQSANRDIIAFATDIVTGAGSVALMLATGGQSAIPGAIATGAASVGRAVVDVSQQHYLTAGSFNAHGTQIATAEPNTIYLTQAGFVTQTTPTNYCNEIGAPFMKADTIGNHSGFIKCQNASISIPGTQADRDAINAMLNSGIFIE